MGALCVKRAKKNNEQCPHCSKQGQGQGQGGLGSLRLGAPAPFWKAKAYYEGEIRTISLEDYKGKYLVFFFYPMDFTFVCPTEIQAFSKEVDKFRNIGCEVVAASTDSVYCHFAWSTKPAAQGGLGPVQFPLLADKNCAIAQAYGVYREDDGITFRGLFIIDGKQNLRQITINDEQVGRSVDEALRLVQAFQFADVHGEVCPVNWKPGQKGIKASVPGGDGVSELLKANSKK